MGYRGKALYLFAYEGTAPQGMGYAAAGNGNGAKVGGGVFKLVPREGLSGSPLIVVPAGPKPAGTIGAPA